MSICVARLRETVTPVKCAHVSNVRRQRKAVSSPV